MIAALQHPIVAFTPTVIADAIADGFSERRPPAPGGTLDAGGRQPRKPRTRIIDPYLSRFAEAAPAEPTRIYDRTSSAVFLEPPSLGQIVDIYA